MGTFGTSLSVRATDVFPWLIPVELWTGFAMAFLEGFAIAFIFNKLRDLEEGSYQQKRLLKFAWVLAISMPFVALPYLLTEQLDISVAELFSNDYLFFLQGAWSIVLLAVPMIILMAVGYADKDTQTLTSSSMDEKGIAEKIHSLDLSLISNKVNFEEDKRYLNKDQLRSNIEGSSIKVKAQELSKEEQGTFSCPDCSYSGSKMGLAVHSSKCKAKVYSNGKEVKVL